MDFAFKRKLIINIVASFGIAIALSVSIWLAAQNINSQTSKIELVRDELNTRINALRSLADLRSGYAQAQPNFAALRSLLPQKDELVNFPKDLGALAKANKVEVGFSFGAEIPAGENQPRATVFNLTLSGTYSDLIRFLKAVEKSKYFVRWESLDVTRSGRSATFSALASGKVFSF